MKIELDHKEIFTALLNYLENEYALAPDCDIRDIQLSLNQVNCVEFMAQIEIPQNNRS